MGQPDKTVRGKVLIADDNAINSELMAQICKAFGWRYDVVDNGEKCVQLLKESASDYSVILMDIHMPGLSGIEAADAIRKCPTDPPRNIKIVAVTADASEQNKLNCEAAGMNAFLTKPIDIMELKATVEGSA